MIPEPQLLDAFAFKKLLSSTIQFHLSRKAMQKSIEFDSQFCGRAVEIKKVRPQRMLSSKFETCKMASSQRVPQLPLLLSLLTAQSPCIPARIHLAQTRSLRAKGKKPLSLPSPPKMGERV